MSDSPPPGMIGPRVVPWIPHGCGQSCTFLTIATLLIALLVGCGSADGDNGTLPPSLSPSPGLGTVLVVVPDEDFQQQEYSAVRTALGEAGYPMQVANVAGGDSVSGDVHVRADLAIADAQAADYVGIVLTGGPGAAALFENQPLQALVREAVAAHKVVSAICLAPVVLAKAGVLKGKKATVWADQKPILVQAGCAAQVQEAVVVDGRIVTGNGPNASREFSAAVVLALQGGD
jgi:protease I